jgi:hypothetical protein
MIKKTTLLIALTAAVAASVVALFGGVFGESARPEPIALQTARAEGLQAGFSVGRSTAATVLELQSALQAGSDDPRTYALLGLAYQQRARETGDPSYYTRSDGVLRRALALDGEEAVAISGLASLALARHRFGNALDLARRARDLTPDTARNYGAIGDALVELGRYREAFRASPPRARPRLPRGLMSSWASSTSTAVDTRPPPASTGSRFATSRATPTGSMRSRRPRRRKAATHGRSGSRAGRSRPCRSLSTSRFSATCIGPPAGSARPGRSTR